MKRAAGEAAAKTERALQWGFFWPRCLERQSWILRLPGPMRLFPCRRRARIAGRFCGPGPADEERETMKDIFIKAYCQKANQFYGLKVEQANGVPRVTDFYDIDSATARSLASTADVPGLESAANLRACSGAGCHSRRVAGCTCAEERCRCQQGQGYRFQCLYCKKLHIFSQYEGAEEFDPSRAGSRVRLAQGQEVELSAAGPSALEHILVGVGWDASTYGEEMDVDASVFVCSSEEDSSELVYFGHLEHSSGCVVHLGDNLVGGKNAVNEEAADSENINVYLNRVPEECGQLYFVVNIFSCDERQQDFGSVSNLYIRLSNAKTGQVLVEYTVDQNMQDKTGLVIGKAYRRGGRWMFKAIGRAVYVSVVEELEEYCQG